MYKQPHVPQRRDGENTWTFLDTLVRFLRDFCPAVWNEDKNQRAEIDELKKRIEALEGKGG